ncbi:MAG: polysaccharide biosynthesis tyrosine autokinase [Richelia sp.]|nr:polysaccharide biosynthesis tyrosine autokinase [Richelia sp.]
MTDTGINQKQILTVLFKKDTIDLRKIIEILSRRRWLILGIYGAVISATILMFVTTNPKYKATMQVMVTANSYQKDKKEQEKNNSNTESDEEKQLFIDYSSQKKLMLSDQLISQAVNLLRTQNIGVTLEDITGKSDAKANPNLSLSSLSRPLTIRKISNQSQINNKSYQQVFEIAIRGEQPVKVRKTLVALAQVYKDYNLERQKQRLNQGLTLLNHLLPNIKRDLKQAETKLQGFRKKHNFIDPKVQSKILLESLANIQTKLQTTRGEIKDLQARQNHLNNKIPTSTYNNLISLRLNQSPRYQALLQELQKTEASLVEERKTYTDDAPVVKELLQERQKQIKLLKKEMRKELGNSANASIERHKKTLKKENLGNIEISTIQELSQLQTKISGLRASEKSLLASEKKIRADLNRYPQLIAEYDSLLPEVETHRKTLETVLQQQQSLALEAAQSGFDWKIVEGPQQVVAAGNGQLLNLLGGVIIAPILGIIVALLWELFDDVIYSEQDFRKLNQLRLLGTVNNLTPSHPRQKTLLLPFWGKDNSSVSIFPEFAPLPSYESLDMVYHNIQLADSNFPFKSLMLTSAKSREGKSALTLGLAVSAARIHRRVLVIDANLRNPHLHQVLELTNDSGISLLLLEDNNASFKDYIQPVHPAIDILTAGPIAEDPVKLLSSQRMKDLIEFFEHHYDVVLIDAPSMLGTVDARIIASVCERVVMVGRMGQVTRNELSQATEILDNLNLIGIIANHV